MADDRLKRDKDYKTWVNLAIEYVDYLREYKKQLDPKKDKAAIVKLQNTIEDKLAEIEKYSGYGGFSKPKKPKKITVKAPKPKAFKTAKAPKLPTVKISPPPQVNIKLSGSSVKLPKVEAYTPKANIKSQVRWL